jgi:acetyl/propionyl-CoA carboxylase alpha subunit
VILKRDIVKKQLEIAFYKVTGLKQEEVSVDGYAIQSNIYAENPITGEKSNGRVEYYMEPRGPGVWVESELYEGLTSTPRELVAKIIAWSVDRKTCLARIKRALYEVVVGGLQTNIDYLRQLLNSSVFESGEYNFGEVEKVDRLIASRLNEIEDLHAVVLSSLLEFDDKGAKKYVRRSKALSSILRGEKVSSLKRSAWHYYIALKTTLERHYSQPKRREKRR